ncbi:hypothetical protein HMPREF9545_01987, partial [Escherichia coli MS 16-3]
EPVEAFRGEKLGKQKGCRSRMAQIITLRQIAKPIRLGQWAMPRKPAFPADFFHLNIGDKFAQIVQQRGVDDNGGPAFGLRRLIFRCGIRREKITLPQPCGITGGFETVIEQATCVGMVVVFRGWEQLRQFCEAVDWYQPEAFKQ